MAEGPNQGGGLVWSVQVLAVGISFFSPPQATSPPPPPPHPPWPLLHLHQHQLNSTSPPWRHPPSFCTRGPLSEKPQHNLLAVCSTALQNFFEVSDLSPPSATCIRVLGHHVHQFRNCFCTKFLSHFERLPMHAAKFAAPSVTQP